jgi:hypothetical protein
MSLPGIDTAGAQWGDGFEIETLINVRVAASPLKIVEVGSHESARIHRVRNLNAVSDGLRVLRTIQHEYVRGRTARQGRVATGTRHRSAWPQNCGQFIRADNAVDPTATGNFAEA